MEEVLFYVRQKGKCQLVNIIHQIVLVTAFNASYYMEESLLSSYHSIVIIPEEADGHVLAAICHKLAALPVQHMYAVEAFGITHIVEGQGKPPYILFLGMAHFFPKV